ncbi:SOUL family heme-binding protein [Francisella frigiditurris]|uniref:SOUL heme-binding family protein n=1 Tax=Francisella frigiditurris TaxID=1542390 RepID=A0A1J0KVX6_9GAMM|nr:heme-binding protein [Francisella frigiditurris]APC97871.1 SOUL heme-binding family protein [Francisella frigiditurris]
MLKRFLASIITIFLSGCSIFGISNVPEPNYKSLKTDNNFSIREYKPIIEAQVQINNNDYKSAVNKGFKELFKYITGENISNEKIKMTKPVVIKQNSQKIAMTAPVLVKEGKESWIISFILPESFNIDDAPKPTNNSIKLVEVPQEKVAVINFNGSFNEEAIKENTSKLKNWINHNNLVQIGEPRAAGYNPPWTIPYFRKNEIQIPIK